jgi:hypothetical protein
MKTCNLCGRTLPRTEFYTQKTGVGTIVARSRCKNCYKAVTKQYYMDNREELLERQRKHYKKRRAYLLTYYRDHRAERLRYQRAWYRRRKAARELALGKSQAEAGKVRRKRSSATRRRAGRPRRSGAGGRK